MKNVIPYILLICIICFLLYEIYMPYKRYKLTIEYFEKAKLLSKNKNKKIMVIGDPCSINFQSYIQKLLPKYQHGDITIDLFGCDCCDKMNINNTTDWKKYNTNEYVVIETATLSFGKNLNKILREIKRISGGDFISSGGTTTIGWKLIGNKLYSVKYPNSIQNIIYPFDSKKDRYYKYYNLNSKKTIQIDWKTL